MSKIIYVREVAFDGPWLAIHAPSKDVPTDIAYLTGQLTVMQTNMGMTLSVGPHLLNRHESNIVLAAIEINRPPEILPYIEYHGYTAEQGKLLYEQTLTGIALARTFLTHRPELLYAWNFLITHNAQVQDSWPTTDMCSEVDWVGVGSFYKLVIKAGLYYESTGHRYSFDENENMPRLKYMAFLWGFETYIKFIVDNIKEKILARNPLWSLFGILDTHRALTPKQVEYMMKIYDVMFKGALMWGFLESHVHYLSAGVPEGARYFLELADRALVTNVATGQTCLSDHRFNEATFSLMWAAQKRNRERATKLTMENFTGLMGYPPTNKIKMLMRHADMLYASGSLNASELQASWGDRSGEEEYLTHRRDQILSDIETAMKAGRKIGWIGRFFDTEGNVLLEPFYTNPNYGERPFWLAMSDPKPAARGLRHEEMLRFAMNSFGILNNDEQVIFSALMDAIEML